MRIISSRDAPWQRADPNTFSGRARVKRLGGVDRPDKIRLYLVEFSASGKTNWHEHTGIQILQVVKGTCLIQKWEDELMEVAEGNTVLIEPGEKHWHGAGDELMTHLAVNINADTRWMEAVGSDDST